MVTGQSQIRGILYTANIDCNINIDLLTLAGIG